MYLLVIQFVYTVITVCIQQTNNLTRTKNKDFFDTKKKKFKYFNDLIYCVIGIVKHRV